jgi:hypothetical protein
MAAIWASRGSRGICAHGWILPASSTAFAANYPGTGLSICSPHISTLSRRPFMPTELTPLTLPSAKDILLTQLLSTDGKVDRLLPLLDLLEIPESDRSDLGQALIEALMRIAEETRLNRELREALQADLSRFREDIDTMSARMARIEARIGTLMQPISQILKILSAPIT